MYSFLLSIIKTLKYGLSSPVYPSVYFRVYEVMRSTSSLFYSLAIKSNHQSIWRAKYCLKSTKNSALVAAHQFLLIGVINCTVQKNVALTRLE